MVKLDYVGKNSTEGYGVLVDGVQKAMICRNFKGEYIGYVGAYSDGDVMTGFVKDRDLGVVARVIADHLLLMFDPEHRQVMLDATPPEEEEEDGA